ncbi:MAG: glycosyltransferase [Chitinophagales bacterium]|nr:glycosyltransferase [Chitinophagales bacterium]MDW8428172.1 glycosyltransferase [Chitinophagales bacterium]
MQSDRRLKVLFLTRWYPNRVDKLDGNFIENHARAVSLYCDLAVLFVGADPHMSHRTWDVSAGYEYGYYVVRVWYRNNDVPRKGIGRVIKFFRYVYATWIGWRLIRARWGFPDVCHVHIFTRPSLLALWLRLWRGTPFLLTEHSSHFVHELPEWLPPKKQFAKFVARQAFCITVVSRSLHRAISDFGLTGRYEIVPNVVFIPELHEMVRCYPPRIVAIAGFNDDRKNIRGLIDVFAQVAKRIAPAQLHILCPISDPRLYERAKATGLLNQRIFLHGPMPNDEVYRLLGSSAFLVVNSSSETFSMAAAEALACGIPVISTRCGGPEEFLDGSRGLLIDLHAPQQLAEALIYMFEHYHQYDREALQRFVREHFSALVVGRRIYSLYLKAMKSANAKDHDP